jgi:Cu/Ag efflux pump CusA
VEISEKIAKELPKIQKNLPSDIKLGYIVDTSDNIRSTIASLVETVLFALLFVGIVVFVFLGRWRATVIVLVTIPISLIASFIYLYVTGNSLNIVSLSALSIAIGMVVDDAIVVLENVTTHIERGSAPMQAAVNGTNEVALSVMASTLTLIAVFFPLTLVKGMTGVLFKQLGWMVTIMMVLSLICALMLTPMLCSRMLRLNVGDTKIFQKVYGPILKVLNKIDDFYAKVLDKCVAHRWITTATALGVFIVSIFLMIFHRMDYKMRVRINSDTVDRKVMTMCVGSGPGYGQTPSAVPYNGMLDVSLVYHTEIMQVLAGLWLLVTGRFLNHRSVHPYRTREVLVDEAKHALVGVDGRLIGTPVGPYRITIEEEVINFLIPD